LPQTDECFFLQMVKCCSRDRHIKLQIQFHSV